MKIRYVLIFIFGITLLVVFKTQPFIELSDNKDKYVIPLEKKSGIDSIISLYDSLLSAEINNSATVGAAVVIIYKNRITLLSEDTTILSNNARDMAFATQVVSPLRWFYLKHWDKVDSKHYALGWRIIGYKGRKVAYHGGFVRGYRADVALCREENIGIAFLTNSPNRFVSKSIPSFLNLYFDFIDKRFNTLKLYPQSKGD